MTGSSGLLGLATIRYLAALPTTEVVVAIDVLPPDPALQLANVVYLSRDIRAPLGDMFALHGTDAVVHLAYLLRTSRDGSAAHSVNVGGTEALLRSCEGSGVRQIVYLSSTTVYGAHGSYTRPYIETDPVNPVKGFQYSEQKLEAERLLAEYASSRPQTAVSVLRGCVIMAAGAENFITQALGKGILPVPMGANPQMQFLHVDDYLSAVGLTLAQGASGVYNLAGEGTVPWRDMVATAGARLVPVPGPLLRGVVDLSWRLRLQGQSPACGLNFITYPWLVSTSKFEKELGWRPHVGSRAALQEWAVARAAAR